MLKKRGPKRQAFGPRGMAPQSLRILLSLKQLNKRQDYFKVSVVQAHFFALQSQNILLLFPTQNKFLSLTSSRGRPFLIRFPTHFPKPITSLPYLTNTSPLPL